jgi:hypothetical protein
MVQILEPRPQRRHPNLTLHCGAHLVELDQVSTVNTPPATNFMGRRSSDDYCWVMGLRKDARDAHQITSRICGICGDNHATCALYAQQMAFGVTPPPLAEWIINLGEAAEYMFDHNLFQDNLVGVDFCEQMVRETNPGVLAKAETTEAPQGKLHGYRTIADIMRALNPFSGAFYLEALQMSRLTREMFCLMEGRHAHPSTLYPGGVGTVASVQVFNDYLVRLLRYIDFLKRCVPLHDDLFDFFYEALPGYEEVGRRRVLLGCWGSFQNQDVCDFKYETMSQWGRAMYVTPGIVIDGKLITTDLVDINLGIRILLGSSFYEDWNAAEKFVTHDPLGHPVDHRHPWNQTTLPKNRRSWSPSRRTCCAAIGKRWTSRKMTSAGASPPGCPACGKRRRPAPRWRWTSMARRQPCTTWWDRIADNSSSRWMSSLRANSRVSTPTASIIASARLSPSAKNRRAATTSASRSWSRRRTRRRSSLKKTALIWRKTPRSTRATTGMRAVC